MAQSPKSMKSKNEMKKMEATNIQSLPFLSIQWHKEDIEVLFEEKGIPINSESIEKFITNIRTKLEDHSVSEGWFFLNEAVKSLKSEIKK